MATETLELGNVDMSLAATAENETGRRYRQADVPLRYIARDLILEDGKLQPQHAVWDLSYDQPLRWVNHPEGGIMSPFSGPNEVWEELIKDARGYGA